MTNWWRRNGLWLSIYILFLAGSLMVIYFFQKTDIHQVINGLNNVFFDAFFKVFTEFGAFPLIAAIAIITLFIRFRITLTLLTSSIIAVVLTQLGKRVIWPDSPRPKVFFGEMDSFHVVEGVNLHSAHSFPSGHTSGAFALFIVLTLYVKSPWLKLLFLFAALMVAYSRMYLSQHFLVDVTAGSFIGLIAAFLAFWWLNTPANKGKEGLDKRLRLSRPWIG